jgi:hypothetical protein
LTTGAIDGVSETLGKQNTLTSGEEIQKDIKVTSTNRSHFNQLSSLEGWGLKNSRGKDLIFGRKTYWLD